MMTQETVRKMNALKLYGMAHAFTSQLETPTASHLSFEERLGLLIDHEVSFRDDRRLRRLLANAKLREPACMEDIDYQSRRGLDRGNMASLGLCNWIKAGVNLAITGKTGVGKTWIACALGNQACRHGMTVKFERMNSTSANTMKAAVAMRRGSHTVTFFPTSGVSRMAKTPTGASAMPAEVAV